MSLIDKEKCYSLGTSLNYAGNKMFAINKIDNQSIVRAILNEIIE